VRKASLASITASVPPMLWLVIQALAPLEAVADADVAKNVIGQRAQQHIGLTELESSRPNAGNLSCAAVSSGK